MNKNPKNLHKYLNVVLILIVVITVVKLVHAATPNPGHDFSAIGGGVAQGDILYGSAADTLSALAKNTSSTRYLSNTGTSNNPAWAQVDLTNGITGILTSVNGGTGNGFTKFSGPATSEKTFTLPNANATVLTDNTAVTVAQGGTGATTLSDAGVLIGNGTSAVQVTSAGTAGQVLTSNGAGADPTFQNAAGGGGTSKFVVKGTDENVPSGTTLQNDDTLTWSVASGETWIFDFTLRVTNINNATPDWKSAVLGASGWTCAWTMYGIVGTTIDVKGNGTDCDNAPTAVADATVAADAGIPLIIHMHGWITTTSSGSVTLQWAPNTSGSLTVQAGSYVRAQKVGGT